jgi:hypothetical protein
MIILYRIFVRRREIKFIRKEEQANDYFTIKSRESNEITYECKIMQTSKKHRIS